MSRSLKKGPYVDEKLLKKVMNAIKTGERKPIKLGLVLYYPPEMVGMTFVFIMEKIFTSICRYMVGHKWENFHQLVNL